MPDVSPIDHLFLYRAIARSSWFRQRSLAFRCRRATEKRPKETGLSVILTNDCTRKICRANQDPCFGEFVLETLAVAARWPVEKTSPNHARITGVPLHGEDEVEIEDAATDLAALISSVHGRPSE